MAQAKPESGMQIPSFGGLCQTPMTHVHVTQ